MKWKYSADHWKWTLLHKTKTLDIKAQLLWNTVVENKLIQNLERGKEWVYVRTIKQINNNLDSKNNWGPTYKRKKRSRLRRKTSGQRHMEEQIDRKKGQEIAMGGYEGINVLWYLLLSSFEEPASKQRSKVSSKTHSHIHMFLSFTRTHAVCETSNR